MRALLVSGARPNFMKVAPLYRAMRSRSRWEPILVHTGQHYDPEMSGVFFDSLRLPSPDHHLGVGAASPLQQVVHILEKIEPLLRSIEPALTIVVGDVSSTLAAALASSFAGIPIAHVEAGLRSRDWSMPEERNRVLTDRLSRFLFTPSADADENLRSEGIEPNRIFLVGNIMIDSLDWIRAHPPENASAGSLPSLPARSYGLVTLHRPSNVDDPRCFARVAEALRRVSDSIPLVFPVHPRTRARMKEFGIELASERLHCLPPLPYFPFVRLLVDAALVLTDSGGIQEEALVLGVPCLTMRENTERPVTSAMGGNRIVGSDPDRIFAEASDLLAGGPFEPRRPPLWDGRTAERIVDVLENGTPG